MNSPNGIDFHPPQNAMIVSRNDPDGSDKNFKRVTSTGGVTNWTGLTGLGFGPPGEIKVGIVQTTANGWIQGDMYFGTGVAGKIGKASADGTSTNTNWATLSGETNLLLGGFYIDQTGIFGGDLIVVGGSGGVWRVTAATSATKVAQVNDANGIGTDLEGVLTVPNSPQYGPWAGKIVTCAESLGLICAVDLSGNVSFHNLGLRTPEDVRLIPSPVKNLYALDFDGSSVWKVAAGNFTGFEGDILLVDEFIHGCVGGTSLFLVHWDGGRFVVRQINLNSFGAISLEHVQLGP